MTKNIYINVQEGFDEIRIAIANKRKLLALDIEQASSEPKKARIYKAILKRIEPSLEAVFVDYGADRHGFLPLKEISPDYFNPNTSESSDMKERLNEGQELLVQIDKEERGNKGAALTTYISLAGCYAVLMPKSQKSGGISRRIEGEERDQLKAIVAQLDMPKNLGLIIRTAGINKSLEEIQWDVDTLQRQWDAIQKAYSTNKGPCLIYKESDLIVRTVRDYLRQDIDAIYVDDEGIYNKIKAYIDLVRPNFSERVKHYKDKVPLFTAHHLESQINDVYQREVKLPSGGSLVIDVTEAIVAIDINSSKATKTAHIEETALQTNLEAAEEIAKQLRLRDLGGLIVIDFIDMTASANQREVENRLRDATSTDRARIQITRISRFGLLEMSRQRINAALIDTIHDHCNNCNGKGRIIRTEPLALRVLRQVQGIVAKERNYVEIQLQCPVELATYILNEKRDAIKALEDDHNAKIIVISNRYMTSPNYSLDKFRDGRTKESMSYEQVEKPSATSKYQSNAKRTKIEEAVVEQIVQKQAPAAQVQKRVGLIQRLVSKLLAPKEETPKKKTHSRSTHKRKQHSNQRRRNNSQHPKQRNQRNTSRNQNRANQTGSKTQDRRNKPTEAASNNHEKTELNKKPAAKRNDRASGNRRRQGNRNRKPVNNDSQVEQNGSKAPIKAQNVASNETPKETRAVEAPAKPKKPLVYEKPTEIRTFSNQKFGRIQRPTPEKTTTKEEENSDH